MAFHLTQAPRLLAETLRTLPTMAHPPALDDGHGLEVVENLEILPFQSPFAFSLLPFAILGARLEFHR